MTRSEKINKIYKVTESHICGFFKEHAYLSNFYPQKVLYNGVVYPHNEAAYQAQKTLDIAVRIDKFTECTAWEARKEGRKLNLREDWLSELPEEEQVIEKRDFTSLPLITTVRDRIMYDLNKIKFSNPYLRNLLMSTDDKHLEETNWWRDDYWGVWEGNGLNKLGRILMKIRNEIRNNQIETL